MILTFKQLRDANATRSLRWHKTGLDEWSLADWAVAVGGEIGEALNVVKKLNRDEDGQPGNTRTRVELIEDLGAELSDTIIYADILLQAAGDGPLGVLWGWDDFADARASSRYEFPDTTILSRSEWAAGLIEAGGSVATAALDHPSAVGPAVDELLKAADAVAQFFGVDLGKAVIAKFNVTSRRYGFPERLGEPASHCEACAGDIFIGDTMLGGETPLCGECAPTFEALLKEPEFFVDAEGDPLTPDACRAWYDEHILAGGKATDSMATLVKDL